MHTKGKMDTRIQHENKPSQDILLIFWLPRDFATANEVAAGAWGTPPAAIRWLKMPSRMAQFLRSEPNLNSYFIVCPSGVNFGQCNACIKSSTKCSTVSNGPRQAKNYHPKCAASDHLAHARSLIRAFVPLLIYSIYPMILLAESEGLGQTAWKRSLIWAFAVRTCPKTRYRMARPRCKGGNCLSAMSSPFKDGDRISDVITDALGSVYAYAIGWGPHPSSSFNMSLHA